MKYWLVNDKNQTRPYSLERLLKLNIDSNSKVWHVGLNDWQEINECESLINELKFYSINRSGKIARVRTTKKIASLAIFLSVGIWIWAFVYNQTVAAYDNWVISFLGISFILIVLGIGYYFADNKLLSIAEKEVAKCQILLSLD